MEIGDKVRVNLLWKFGFQSIEKVGIIEEMYSNGMLKVKIPLKHGGYRTVVGHMEDCTSFE